MKECNVCLEETKTKKCFHKCSFRTCNNCIIQILETDSCVTYKCPQCRKIKTFINDKSKMISFVRKNNDILEGIITKYIHKFNYDSSSSDTE